MRSTRILLIFLLATSLLSCKKDDDANITVFLLSNKNLAGTHALTFLSVVIDQTFDINGIPVTSQTTVVGDTFQVLFIFAENGTYTAEGEFRITVTTTVLGETRTETEIIVLDENGTYQLNANAQTITIDGGGEYSNGTFDVVLFNETEFRITQELTDDSNNIITDTQSELRFVRQ